MIYKDESFSNADVQHFQSVGHLNKSEGHHFESIKALFKDEKLKYDKKYCNKSFIKASNNTEKQQTEDRKIISEYEKYMSEGKKYPF